MEIMAKTIEYLQPNPGNIISQSHSTWSTFWKYSFSHQCCLTDHILTDAAEINAESVKWLWSEKAEMNTGFCVRLSVRMKDGFEWLVLFLVFFFQVKIKGSMCLEIVCVCTQASAWWRCEGGGSLGAGGGCRFCTGIAEQGLSLRAIPPPLPAGGTGAAPALAVSLGGRQAEAGHHPWVGIRIRHGRGACVWHFFLLWSQSFYCVKEKGWAVLSDLGKTDEGLKQLPPEHRKRNNILYLLL